MALPGGTTEVRSGYYNYFYIGGYQDDTLGYKAWQRALWYASGMKNPSSNTSYLKPWCNKKDEDGNMVSGRVWAIRGGAQYFYKNYLAKGQNTLYKKRFNNNNNQYCTNITAARDEGWLLGEAYTEELRTSTTLKFYIPVYSGMPAAACAKPE